MNDRTPTEATWLLKQGATPEQALERIAQRIAVWRDADPDEDESWESFYEAAFDMLSAEVDDIISAASKPIAASPPAPAAEPVAMQWRVLEKGSPKTSWRGADQERERAQWESVAKSSPKTFTIEERPLYTHPLDAAAIRAEARREALEEAACTVEGHVFRPKFELEEAARAIRALAGEVG